MKKAVLMGFGVGLIATTFGLIIAIQIFGNSKDWEAVITQALSNGTLTQLMSIGALLNLAAFFLFLRRNQDLKAKGVLIATLLVFISTLVIKSFF